MGSFLKSFFTTLFIFIILFAALIAGLFYFYRKDGQALDDKFQILVLGVDSLDSSKADNARSDTIMIANIDLSKKSANVISIPRDTYADIRGYKKQKINHSYKYGGPELTLESVNNLLGLNIKRYIVIDYKFVEEMVDKLGGIDVDVPMDMNYEDPTADPPLKIHIQKGQRNLNGIDAVGFLRFRKGYINQDLGRVEAQQQFVSALFSKLKDKKNWIKAPSIYLSYKDHTKNNIPSSMIFKIAVVASEFNRENIKSDTLPGYPKYISNISYFIMDEKKADVVLKNFEFK